MANVSPPWAGNNNAYPDWQRTLGLTRALIIDDDVSDEWLGDDEDARAKRLKLLQDEFGVILTFSRELDRGTKSLAIRYDEKWMSRIIEKYTAGEKPIPLCAIFLDLKFGGNDNAGKGRDFLRQIRGNYPALQNVPVLYFTSTQESDSLSAKLKSETDEQAGDGKVQFQGFVHKSGERNEALLKTFGDALIEWGLISDPALSAYSESMRMVARQMRRIVLAKNNTMKFEEGGERFPRPVVFLGSYGSGKNYAAERLFHMQDLPEELAMQTVTFSAIGRSTVASDLFGTAPFTGRAFEDGFYIRKFTGERDDHGRPRDPKWVRLVAQGALLLAHQNGLRYCPNDRPFKGIVLLDEFAACPKTVQRALLGVFNRGKFKPHLESTEIPDQLVKLWFLVTAETRAWERVAEDVRMRLERGYVIRIPDLCDREEDMIPLATHFLNDVLEFSGKDFKSPNELFSEPALKWLEENAGTMSVRELNGLMRRLEDQSSLRPYNRTDLIAADDRRKSSTSSAGRGKPGADNSGASTAGARKRRRRLTLERIVEELLNHDEPMWWNEHLQHYEDAKRKLADVNRAVATLKTRYLELVATVASGFILDDVTIKTAHKFASGITEPNIDKCRQELLEGVDNPEAIRDAIQRLKYCKNVFVDARDRASSDIKKALAEARPKPDVDGK